MFKKIRKRILTKKLKYIREQYVVAFDNLIKTTDFEATLYYHDEMERYEKLQHYVQAKLEAL